MLADYFETSCCCVHHLHHRCGRKRLWRGVHAGRPSIEETRVARRAYIVHAIGAGTCLRLNPKPRRLLLHRHPIGATSPCTCGGLCRPQPKLAIALQQFFTSHSPSPIQKSDAPRVNHGVPQNRSSPRPTQASTNLIVHKGCERLVHVFGDLIRRWGT